MPRKGQQLYVRRVAGPAELASLAALGGIPVPAAEEGWVGFLVGEPVALASASREGDRMLLEMLVVDRGLLRKRIGTVMLREIAADLGGDRLDVRNGVLPDGFLHANGYAFVENRFTRESAEARNP